MFLRWRVRRALGVMNSSALVAEVGCARRDAGFCVVLLLLGVPASPAAPWRGFEGVASGSVFFASDAGLKLDFGFDFDGVPPDLGDSISNSPRTSPFFCGVGPMNVRGGLGVMWVEGGS